MLLLLSEEIANPKSTLRIKIDNDWYLNDFENLFDSLKTLYRINLIENLYTQKIQFDDRISLGDLIKEYKIDNLQVYKKISNPLFLDYYKFGANSLFSQTSIWKNNIYELKVNQIQFASPGFGDFGGLGEIFKTIVDTFKYYFPNQREKFETQMTEVELVQKKVNLYKSLGLSDSEIRELIIYF